MAHQDHHQKLQKLNATIIKEIQNGEPEKVGRGMRILNRLRKYQDKLFHHKFPGIETKSKGDIDTLNSHEQAIYNEFSNWSKVRTDLCGHYGEQYRGGYILNYNFAVLAVSLAAISLGLLYAAAKLQRYSVPIELLILLLGVIKFFLLYIIFINTGQSEKQEFNRRAIAHRYISEQFRIMSYISLLGIRRIPPPSVSRFVSNEWSDNTPVQQYFKKEVEKIFIRLDSSTDSNAREIVYSTRLVPIMEFIKTDWLTVQQEYHKSKGEKFGKINEKLEKRVSWLNPIVMIAIAVDVIVGVAGFLEWITHGMHSVFHYYFTPVILVGATTIPALVASYNGKRSQAEAKKEIEREAFMLKQLEEFADKHSKLIEKIKVNAANADSPGAYTQEAITLVYQTAQVMIDEVAEWTFVYTKETMEV